MQLRDTLGDLPELAIVWVMAEGQINDKSRRLIQEAGLAPRLHFLADPDSRLIDRLGLRRPDTEAIEAGVPHPSTYLLDREGRVRLADVREDYHFWLDPELLRRAVSELP